MYEVEVLMGDFNMSLFRVILELRSRGAVVDLGAWYPWKSLKGEPMSDSCGILFVDLPGVYTLNETLGDIHDRDSVGVLVRVDPVRSGEPVIWDEDVDDDSAVAGSSEDFDESEDDSPNHTEPLTA